MRLADSVALVTGGGSGIGRAIAERFAREGARVVVADLVEARAKETAAQIAVAGGAVLAVAANVAVAAEVEALAARALEAYGRVDILINNAGAARGDDIREIDEETWDFNLDVVLKSAYLCSRALVPQMIARRKGAIVNISSVNGLVALGGEGYSAAKAGMISLTQNMAVKYGQHNLRVNCVCPGTIHTPIWDDRVAANPQIFDQLAAWYPLGRVGRPDDVANAALYLASEEAAWVTGTVLTVDGGLLAGTYRMSEQLGGR